MHVMSRLSGWFRSLSAKRRGQVVLATVAVLALGGVLGKRPPAQPAANLRARAAATETNATVPMSSATPRALAAPVRARVITNASDPSTTRPVGSTTAPKRKARTPRTAGAKPAKARRVSTPPGVTAARTFENCKHLNSVYPHGVGRPGAVDRKRAGSSSYRVRNFKVSAALYQANEKSDGDGDGIACEKR